MFVSKGGGTRGTRLLCDCSVRGGQPLLVEEKGRRGGSRAREQGTGDRGQGTTGEETAQKQVHTIS